MKKRIESDEIDLAKVIINIWNNKLKIATITAIFMIISAALYLKNMPPLKAKTEILPINIFENNMYKAYNSLLVPPQEVLAPQKDKNSDDKKILSQPRLNNFNQNYLLLNKIDKDYLLKIFLEELQNKKIVIEAIKKFKLIDQSKFNNEDDYLKAVENYALKLNLLRPINVEGSSKGETSLNWIIEFQVYDKDKYEMALSFIDNEINKKIKKYLIESFNQTLSNLKLLNQFKQEDLEIEIKNIKNDYDNETINQLAFLREQALIARKLNIENKTLEVENFGTPSGVIANIKTDTPYYMRGYLMIEKEIELIETRTNKDAFNKNLLYFEKQKRYLLADKTLERIEKLFNSTPIVNDNNFKAASIFYIDTKYKTSYSLTKAVLFAGIFGIIFGMLYVLISNVIQQRK